MEQASVNGEGSRFKRVLKFSGAFCLMAGALTYLFFGDTAVAQMWRMRRASRHQDVVLQRLALEPRYQKIKVSVLTTGSLYIQGVLPSESDLQALKDIVATTRPPVHVDYRVVVVLK